MSINLNSPDPNRQSMPPPLILEQYRRAQITRVFATPVSSIQKPSHRSRWRPYLIRISLSLIIISQLLLSGSAAQQVRSAYQQEQINLEKIKNLEEAQSRFENLRYPERLTKLEAEVSSTKEIAVEVRGWMIGIFAALAMLVATGALTGLGWLLTRAIRFENLSKGTGTNQT